MILYYKMVLQVRQVLSLKKILLPYFSEESRSLCRAESGGEGSTRKTSFSITAGVGDGQ